MGPKAEGEKKQSADAFVPLVKALAQNLLKLYTKKHEITFQDTGAMERQILAVYLFGMSNALFIEENIKITPSQVEKGMVAVLAEVFRYSVPQATGFVKGIIADMQSKDESNTIYIIIYRGLEGYFAYQEGKSDEVIEDISNIVEVLQAKR